MWKQELHMPLVNRLSAEEIVLMRALSPGWTLPPAAYRGQERMTEAIGLAHRQTRRELTAGRPIHQERTRRAPSGFGGP